MKKTSRQTNAQPQKVEDPRWQAKTPRSKYSTGSNDICERLAQLTQTLPWIEMRNFDSNGMEQDEVDALKAEIASLDAERIALINSAWFRAEADV